MSEEVDSESGTHTELNGINLLHCLVRPDSGHLGGTRYDAEEDIVVQSDQAKRALRSDDCSVTAKIE